MRLNPSDWIAVLALVVASGALALEVRRWFESGPRLHLSLMADAVEFPHGDGEPKLALTVINRGGASTTLTHMVGYVYPSRWAKYRHRPAYAGLVNSSRIPSEIGINHTWMGMMNYAPKLSEARQKGQLYVGVIASHASGVFLVWVPPPRDDLPNEKIA